jgi:hypothetical protein
MACWSLGRFNVPIYQLSQLLGTAPVDDSRNFLVRSLTATIQHVCFGSSDVLRRYAGTALGALCRDLPAELHPQIQPMLRDLVTLVADAIGRIPGRSSLTIFDAIAEIIGGLHKPIVEAGLLANMIDKMLQKADGHADDDAEMVVILQAFDSIVQDAKAPMRPYAELLFTRASRIIEFLLPQLTVRNMYKCMRQYHSIII